MSYQVLARRWRPRNFSQIVGQQHVLKPLVNALDHDRLHHAFLFTGTRGVGKTTLARILAKSINCEAGVSATPCGKCSSCQEIDEGRFVDLIEVDAASRTKVDDTRELLDNVQYVPTRGRYKVYLIDEVHMLSRHSFNALLKTLEEPPPHVKFIFATTDPQKLPATILSRCLQFNLKQLTVGEIQGQLAHILDEEQGVFSDDALWEIAGAAHGSMRDALSLLDQALSYGNGELKRDEVCEMLGTIDRSRIVQLLQQLIGGHGGAMLDEIAQIGQLGGDYASALNEVNHALQQIAIYQVIPDSANERFGQAEQLREIATQIDRESVQLYYQIGINGLKDLPLAPDLRSGFEMVMLRMLAFQPQISASQPPSTAASTQPVTQTAGAAPQQAEAAQISQKQGSPHDSPTVAHQQVATPDPDATAKDVGGASQDADATVALQPSQTAGSQVESEAAQPPAESTLSVAGEMFLELQKTSDERELDQQWFGWVNALPLTAMVRQLAENCVLIGVDSDTIYLHLLEPCAHLRHKQREKVLTGALSSFLERKIGVEIEVSNSARLSPAAIKQQQATARQTAAESSITDDPLVHSMQEQFGAKVIPKSVKPL